MHISERMKTAAHLVTQGNITADIGCDHAYTSIYLVKEKRAPHVIAMDLREGPLKRARINIKKYQCEEQVETRLSNGVQGLKPGEAESILIAGMGGLLVKRILAEGSQVIASAGELILQPQSDLEQLRKYLHQAGFQILDEKMLIEDGKYYTVIKAGKGTEKYEADREYRYGRVLLERQDPCLLEFLKVREQKLLTLLSCIKDSEKAKADRIRIKEEYTQLKEAYKYFKKSL